MTDLTRRKFLQATGASIATTSLFGASTAQPQPPLPSAGKHDGVAISSANGLETVKIAHQLMLNEGMRPVSAAIRGVAVVEADPNDMSVGYGGLPNELGVVQLDSSCMDGPTHNAGSVACIEDIMHPAQVAELVMDRTDHINLVGKGARQFAIDHGFKTENLLTDRAREIWLKWRAKRTDDDR
ncbi:MAG TPA: asparaginase, partial [Planctomycetes bacterium]|nr:asparaginase [Planctomycetota bacterium]